MGRVGGRKKGGNCINILEILKYDIKITFSEQILKHTFSGIVSLTLPRRVKFTNFIMSILSIWFSEWTILICPLFLVYYKISVGY